MKTGGHDARALTAWWLHAPTGSGDPDLPLRRRHRSRLVAYSVRAIIIFHERGSTRLASSADDRCAVQTTFERRPGWSF